MLHQQTLFGIEDKVKNSIDALRSFEPPEGYFLAFSGGKDSVVVKQLCDMAGVKYDAHYHVTSCDPPELVQFIKQFHPDVKREIPHDKEGNPVTMWNLIPKKKMPPTRLARYCCQQLKEHGGEGRFTITGVRWAESKNRKDNQGIVTVYNASKEMKANPNFAQTVRGGVILNNDNDDARELLESCYRYRKTVLNPIINWTDDEVWEFIREFQLPYCKLYDEGIKRLGCIGCPMGGGKSMLREFERWPKYKTFYLHAFEKMLKNKELDDNTTWTDAQAVFDWWTEQTPRREIDGQVSLEDL